MLADVTNASSLSKRKLDNDTDSSVNKTLDHHIAARRSACRVAGSSATTDENCVLSGKGPAFSNKRVTTVTSRAVGAYSESDVHRVESRLKQISFGKNTKGYDNYIKLISVKRRVKDFYECPRTPDPYEKTSKRAFDGSVKNWRRMLHEWDDEGRAAKKAELILSSGSDEGSSRMLQSNAAAMSGSVLAAGAAAGVFCLEACGGSFDALVDGWRDELKYHVSARLRASRATLASSGHKMAVEVDAPDSAAAAAAGSFGVSSTQFEGGLGLEGGDELPDDHSDDDVL